MSNIDKREVCKREMLGKIFKSNSHGEVIVIGYITSKKILVRFIDCGSEQVVQKYNLERGLIKPNGNGRLKIRSEEDFKNQLIENAKEFLQISRYIDSKNSVDICCRNCGKVRKIKPSEASQGIRCTSCNPSPYRTPHKSYKDFANDITLPDGWSIYCNTWNGVCDSKIILTHSCGYSTERLSHSIKAFTGFCKRCSDEAKRLINEQKEIDKKNKRENKNKKELTDMLDLAKVVHNCEFDYDLSKLNSHDFMFKAINTPIEITHKPCGSVLNKSLSYHVQGGPDGRPVGCPVCASFGYSYANGSYFYIVTSNDGMFKIGITKNPEQRVAQMNRNKDRVWVKHWQIKLEGDLRPLEKEVLGMLDVIYPKPNSTFDGSTESFVVDGDIVPLSFVREICSTCQK